MASYEGAMDRICYLLGIGEYRASPATINGGPTSVYSYRMIIGYEIEPGLWWVHPTDSSATTNRHIRALRMVLIRAGIDITEEIQQVRVIA